MKGKNGAIPVNRTIIIIALIVGVILIFGVWKPASLFSTGCNLGAWYVSGYDANKQEVTISASIPVVTNGGTLCYGNTLESPTNINDKAFCNSFFGASSWNDEFSKCVPNSEAWFNDKEVKSTYGNCYYNNEGRATYTQDYSPTFDGVKVYFSWSKPQLRDSISCNGGFIVGYKASAVPETPIIPPTEEIPPSQSPNPVETPQVSQKSFLEQLWEWFINLFRA